jgi:hypothetical protein
MIRSARIPGILSRIASDHVIQTAVMVTGDGELLGATSNTFISPDGSTRDSMESLGTLIADIAVDYQRLGEEYALLEPSATPAPKKSHLQCLLLEFDHGLVAISSCVGVDCLVIGIAAPNAPMGMIKARLQAITEHVQEALAPLTEATYR